MQKINIFLCASIASALLSSCAIEKLEPGAENIVVTNKEHTPTQCKELGQVSTFDTNGSSVTYTSHERLEQYQINTLKNKAMDLGGNVLVIKEHETTYTSKHNNDGLVDTHFMEGNVYFCSADQLKSITSNQQNVSDVTPKEAAEDSEEN